MKLVYLWDMPDELMLIVEHPTTVLYRNQVGGVACHTGEIEGALVPVEVSRETLEHIQNCQYLQGRSGISSELADIIDASLAAEPRARYLRVDRGRLDDSWEAWVHVLLDSPEEAVPVLTGSYLGPLWGFGATRGVLTWQNSD